MTSEKIIQRSLGVISLLSTIGMYISGVGIFVMSVLITIEIAGRYVFGFSLLVVDEWSGYLLVIVTFLGLAYTMRAKGFMQMELLTKRLTPRKRNLLTIFLVIVALSYSILIDYRLILIAWSSYSTKYVSVSMAQTPLYIPQLFMPLGMMLLMLELLREGFQSLYAVITDKSYRSQRREVSK
jgi:TRAP-type C4-dicarboxylate transport system permease small subunit